jgi:hypothetical protein
MELRPGSDEKTCHTYRRLCAGQPLDTWTLMRVQICHFCACSDPDRLYRAPRERSGVYGLPHAYRRLQVSEPGRARARAAEWTGVFGRLL